MGGKLTMKKTDKKNPFRKIAVLLASIAVMGIMQQCVHSDAFEKTMIKAASELNKTCPMMVDRETRLDNAVVLPGNIFQYNYTFLNMRKDSVDFVAMQNEMEPAVLNGVKTSPDLKVYREHKVTMAYNYVDKKGAFVFKILITPEKYK